MDTDGKVFEHVQPSRI